MSTKCFADGEVHRYFSPHESPYDAFVTYMNALTDLERRCEAGLPCALAPMGEMAVAV
jgi:alpha-amylase